MQLKLKPIAGQKIQSPCPLQGYQGEYKVPVKRKKVILQLYMHGIQTLHLNTRHESKSDHFTCKNDFHFRVESIKQVRSSTISDVNHCNGKSLEEVIIVEKDDAQMTTISVDVHSDAVDSVQGAAKSSPVLFFPWTLCYLICLISKEMSATLS